MRLGAEELEPLTGFGRDADMKRNTVQHQTHVNTLSNNKVTKRHGGTLIHREREWTSGDLPARDLCGESDPPRGGLSGGPKGGPLNLLRWRISG